MGFNGDLMEMPSGYVKIAIENGPCIMSFPINSMVIFHSCVSLPEGTFFSDIESSWFRM